MFRKRKPRKTDKKAKVKRPPQPPGLSFRPRRKQDDLFLIHVTMAEMKHVYESSIGEELTPDLIRLQLKPCEVTVIEFHGYPIGYYATMPYAPGRLYLGALVLADTIQGKGLGAQVVRRIEQEARAAGNGWIEAHVQTANKRAIRFWLRNGYQIAGRPAGGSFPLRKRIFG